MSAPKNLTDCYTHELQDNWSANEQMEKVVRKMADATDDSSLAENLKKSADGIADSTETVKQLLSDCGISEKEHCKGMEGLVKEATKHVLEADFDDGDVRDVVLISQYQRMSHYGICGFGTAKAYAEALGKSDHVAKLDELTANCYEADEKMTDLATRCANLRAKEAEPA